MNFQTICRICIGENSKMRSIFESYNFSAHYCEIFKVITDCANVQIEKFDGFSQQICHICLDNLSQAYSFKKLCEQSDSKFRNNLITSDKIQIKSEFFEDGSINFNEIHNDLQENLDENLKTTHVVLIQEKREQRDDDIKTEEDQVEIKQDELDAANCSIGSFESMEPSVYNEWVQSKTNKELLQQRKKGTEENTFECNVGTSFALQSSLKSLGEFHKEEKLYKCGVCEKTFTKKERLMCHFRIHTGEKPYKCNFCDKTFSERSNFVRHSRIHTGEKPYKCEVCEKKFSERKKLVQHARVHTGEILFKCEICEKSFSEKYNLVEHGRIHTGEKLFKCDICEKKFTKKDTLMCHTRIHTGEKPYKCDICEKTFSKRGNFFRHSKIHTGEKLFKCDL